MEQLCIGVDLGGTSIKMGIFSADAKLLKKWEIPTDTSNKGENIIKDIAKSIKKELKASDLSLMDCIGIGMGVPGPVLKSGYVKVCVNLGWKDVYPGRELSDILGGIAVYLGNDANVAALGESWQGAAKDTQDTVLVTIGTGVGSGIIIDGKIVVGRHGLAGEIGHIHVEDNESKQCNCGAYGCLEQLASATGIVRLAKAALEKDKRSSLLQNIEKLTAKDVFDSAKAGDEVAMEIVQKVCAYLGVAISKVSLTVDPEVIVIGGGVSKAGSFLTDLIKKEYLKYTTLSDEHADIVLAKLGNDAGIYGAAKLALSALT